ncbi:hypothetical protein [Nostoc sp.]
MTNQIIIQAFTRVMFTTGVAATLPSLSDQTMFTTGYDARSRQRAVGKTR